MPPGEGFDLQTVISNAAVRVNTRYNASNEVFYFNGHFYIIPFIIIITRARKRPGGCKKIFRLYESGLAGPTLPIGFRNGKYNSQVCRQRKNVISQGGYIVIKGKYRSGS